MTALLPLRCLGIIIMALVAVGRESAEEADRMDDEAEATQDDKERAE